MADIAALPVAERDEAGALFELRVDRVRAALHRAATRGEQGDAGAQPTWRRGPERALATRLGLSGDALDFLWTAVAITADPRVAPLAELVGGSLAQKGATLALHAAIFGLDGGKGCALATELAALGSRLSNPLTPEKEGGILVNVPYSVPARIQSFLAERDSVDHLLRRCGGLVAVPADYLADARTDAATRLVEQALAAGEPVLVLIEGPEGVGRRTAAARAAASIGRECVALDLGRSDGIPLQAAFDAWRRECLLRDAVGVVANVDAIVDPEERRRLAALLDEIDGPVVATVRAGIDLSMRRLIARTSIPIPEPPCRHELWRRAVGEAEGIELAVVARRYRLGAGGIDRAARAARLIAAGEALTTATIAAGVRSTLADRLGGLAARVPVGEAWEDLVLPEDSLDQIRALIRRVRHASRVLDDWGMGAAFSRGQGVAALFSGPPGTGKTLAAGIIARELELDVLQVDLSRVISKWVGETEKHLAAVFDAAEAGDALLLFDEADALFAKRTEVKGALDRYANLEVNYLLQRIESFGGVAILTTNFETAIDPAIKRRLAAHVVFPPPDEDERDQLWRRLIPASVPLAGDLDCADLAARFSQLAGGHIRNAVVAAAFAAAGEGTSLAQRHLVAAAKEQLAAMGRLVTREP